MKSNVINRRYLAILFSVILTFVILIAPLSGQKVFAADSATKLKGLMLSPLRTEFNIAPGTSLDGILEVTNSTDKLMVVDMAAEEFNVVDQQYNYAFTPDTNVT